MELKKAFLILFFLLITLINAHSQTTNTFVSTTKKIASISKTNYRYKILFFAGKKIENNKTSYFIRLNITNQKKVYTLTHDQYIFCIPQYFEFTIEQKDYYLVKKLISFMKNQKTQKTKNYSEFNIRLNNGTIIRYSSYPQETISIISNNTVIPIYSITEFTKFLVIAINESYKL